MTETETETELDLDTIRAALMRGSIAAGPNVVASTMLLLASGFDLQACVERGWIQVTGKPAVPAAGETRHDGIGELHATVVNWYEIISRSRSCGGASVESLLFIARSLDTDELVKLRRVMAPLIPAHAARVAEAMLVAAGVDTWFTVTALDAAPEALKNGLKATGGDTP